jgi:nitrogen fixation protein NifU and related proteins
MNDLRDLYQEIILDHGKSPRNFGKPESFTAEADGYNPLCGDKVHIYVTLKDGRVEDVHFEGRGCAISMASASLMTEVLVGKTEAEARALFDKFHELVTTEHDLVGDDDFDRLVVLGGVRQYPSRIKCATLAWHTFNNAITGTAEPAKTE